MNKSDHLAFTVCNVAYLHKALVLADSYYNVTDKTLRIYIVDSKREIDIINKVVNSSTKRVLN